MAKFHLKEYPALRKLVEEMDVETLLGYVVCPHLNPTEIQGIERKSACAFFFPATHTACLNGAHTVNDGRDLPALIVSDMEFGAYPVLSDATPFPSMQALAVGGDVKKAYEMGRVTARQARAAGFHWTFGPCVDITFHHNNPIVSYRCAGDTAEDNIAFGGAYMEGLQDGGLIATLKHFPGDGCCDTDQHLTVSVNPLAKDQWRATYGHVYQSLITRGARAVMVGHIALPSYDDFDEQLGYYPPATLSKKLMKTLLREELGFDGIIISDATTMGGFAGCMNLYRACARFLECGGDCLLFMHADQTFLSEMQKCMARGELSLHTLRNRAYRMLCFAKQYFEQEQTGSDGVEQPANDAAAWSLARRVVHEACVVGRDRMSQLPLQLNADARILHVVITTPEYPADASAALTQALRARFVHVDELIDPGPYRLRDLAAEHVYDQIICTVGGQLSFGTDTCRLTGAVARNMMEGWMRYDTPVVFVNFGHPYFQEEYVASVDTIINTYGYTSLTVEAVMDRLFGEGQKENE